MQATEWIVWTITLMLNLFLAGMIVDMWLAVKRFKDDDK